MIDPRAIIDPSAVIGSGVSIGPWSIIGANVRIGADTQIASHVIIDGPTDIGCANRILPFVHIGADCRFGDHVAVADHVSIAAHTVGAYADIGAMSRVSKDVPPFVAVRGNPAVAVGLNIERLRRQRVAEAALHALSEAYRIVFRQGLTVADALLELQRCGERAPEVSQFIASIAASRGGIIGSRREEHDQ